MKIELGSAYWHLLSSLMMTFLMACGGAANAVTPMVAAGESHSVMLKSDGSVITVGSDSDGQLGAGRLVYSSKPLRVSGLAALRKVSASINFTLALDQEGTAWAWGANDWGQLGDGTRAMKSTPVRVLGVDNLIDLAGGYQHAMAIKGDGTVWTWGGNYFGQLGNGKTSLAANNGPPIMVKGISTVTSIAVGMYHSVVLRQDGTIWVWGDNTYGQLGITGLVNATSPVKVTSMSEVIAISAGSLHTIALRKDGTVWSWGRNQDMQLGDGTTIDSLKPVQVAGLANVTAIDAGDHHSVALKEDGTIWAWGHNGRAELGNGKVERSSPLVQVANLKGAIGISAGGYNSLAMMQDGSVWTWGMNSSGQLGDGTIIWRNTPVQVVNLARLSVYSVGSGHTIAQGQDGLVWAWGDNTHAQLGDGASTNSTTPFLVKKVAGVTQMAAGRRFTVALKHDGAVWAWGDNAAGQLGNGTEVDSSDPVQVANLSNAISVAAGEAHSLALGSDRVVWAWGFNSAGQLGDGTNFYRYTPIKVIDGSSVSAISAGASHNLAVKLDQTVWAWGDNWYGQLGDGTTTVRKTPVQVGVVSQVASVSAGGNFSLALQKDGTVWAWGANYNCQLADGTRNSRSAPERIVGLNSIKAIAAGNSHAVALSNDGTVWEWGAQRPTNAGFPDSNSICPSIEKVKGLSNIAAIGAGSSHSLALGTDGAVWAWGSNYAGQLGGATLATSRLPILMVNSTVDGFINLQTQLTEKSAAAFTVPFFTVATGGIADTSASVSTATKFNPADKGKPGSVFVTAMVPSGSLGVTTTGDSPAIHRLAATPQALASTTTCPAPVNPLTLVQLTPTGWQTVVNGQLLPYASGVLGDQLAAQTILNNVDTTNLKGAEFCVGYGTSAEDMVNNGNIRAVATIPGATTTSTCVVGSRISVGLNVTPGWNLLGNPINQSIAVSAKFGDANKVSSVWKWDTVKANWQLYAPGMDAAALQSYATSHGYGVLTEISPGDGYWVQAKVQADLGSMCGTSINLRQSSLSSGWNLVSTASPISAKEFNLTLSTTPPTAGQVPINMTSLWAWDANQANWYFYAPVLDAQGGSVLSEYISRKTYKDFTSNGKTVGNGVGIWVNRP
jgi:alpha-tubulin suppressor-like RCC1 family protein